MYAFPYYVETALKHDNRKSGRNMQGDRERQNARMTLDMNGRH